MHGEVFKVLFVSRRARYLTKMMPLRWCAVAVCAGIVPGGVASGAHFGVLRLGEGRLSSRGYVGSGEGG